MSIAHAQEKYRYCYYECMFYPSQSFLIYEGKNCEQRKPEKAWLFEREESKIGEESKITNNEHWREACARIST